MANRLESTQAEEHPTLRDEIRMIREMHELWIRHELGLHIDFKGMQISGKRIAPQAEPENQAEWRFWQATRVRASTYLLLLTFCTTVLGLTLSEEITQTKTVIAAAAMIAGALCASLLFVAVGTTSAYWDELRAIALASKAHQHAGRKAK